MRFARRKTSPRAGGGYGPLRHGKHTRNPGWKHGQHWVECQRCGLDYTVSDIKVQWDGLVTCLSCWEPRHPQDFVRGVHDDMRPRGPGNPVGLTNEASTVGSTSVPTGTFNNDLDALGAQSPGDLGATGWWDFSIAGTVGGPVGGVWQDTAGTIPCVDSSNMFRCDDRSGNGFHAVLAAGGPEWIASSAGGFGTGDWDTPGGALVAPDSMPSDAAEWSLLIVARRDSTINGRTILGGTSGGGANSWHFAPFDDVPANRLYHMGFGNTGGAGLDVVTGTILWSGIANVLQWWLIEVNQTDSAIYRPISGSVGLDATGIAWSDVFGAGPIRIGSDGAAGNTWENHITEIALFDKNFTANERTQLYNYHNARYGLSTQI